MNVIHDSLNLLADHVHTDGSVRRQCIRNALDNDQYRFTVHLTHGQSLGPGQPVVIEEIRRVRRLPRKSFGTPMTTSAPVKSQEHGAIAASVHLSPRMPAPRGGNPNWGRSRPAIDRAPATVPIAMIDDSRSYKRARVLIFEANVYG